MSFKRGDDVVWSGVYKAVITDPNKVYQTTSGSFLWEGEMLVKVNAPTPPNTKKWAWCEDAWIKLEDKILRQNLAEEAMISTKETIDVPIKERKLV